MVDLELPDEVSQRMEDGASGKVIAGLRPESFEDAGLVSDPDAPGATFTATIDVIEWLGSEMFAHFEVEGAAAAELEDLAEDLETVSIGTADEQAQLVARLDTQSDAGSSPSRRCGSTPGPCTSSTPTRAGRSSAQAVEARRPRGPADRSGRRLGPRGLALGDGGHVGEGARLEQRRICSPTSAQTASSTHWPSWSQAPFWWGSPKSPTHDRARRPRRRSGPG